METQVTSPQRSIAGFAVRDATGNEMKLGDILGRVSLLVNVDAATSEHSNAACVQLQELYERHAGRGFVVIAFPCDQFQLRVDKVETSVSAKEVQQALAKQHHVTFPVLDKVSIVGDTAHPLFVHLQKEAGGLASERVTWDFTKFLIVNGQPVKRYAPTASPDTVEADVIQALATSSVEDMSADLEGSRPDAEGRRLSESRELVPALSQSRDVLVVEPKEESRTAQRRASWSQQPVNVVTQTTETQFVDNSGILHDTPDDAKDELEGERGGEGKTGKHARDEADAFEKKTRSRGGRRSRK